MTSESTARLAFRVIAFLLILQGVLAVARDVLRGYGSTLYSAVNLVASVSIGFGLWDAKEWAWLVAVLLGGLAAGLQLAFVVGARDLAFLFSALFNSAIVAMLIWAGRALSQTPATTKASA